MLNKLLVCLAFLLAHAATVAAAPAAKLDNAACLTCHDGQKGKLEVADADGEKRKLRDVHTDKYGKSVHARMECVACHTDITDNVSPHQKTGAKTADCATCHQALWDKAKQAGSTANQPRMEVVARNIAAYKQSFHARPDKDKPSQPKATCTQCHDTHAFAVPADKQSPQYAAWRKDIPKLCGESCHDDQLEAFASSVHGKEVIDKANAKAPVCTSCHTNHEITNTSLVTFKLLNNEECGNCHKDNLKSYRDTYHGQVTRLGYAETAKCFDCHGSHKVLGPKDPKSKVHPDNRLKTCRQCHDGKKKPLATAGFASFGPHANSHDFARYPQMWIATKSMIALLIGVFAFFWLHSGLWYYREWQDRKQGKSVPHVRTDSLPPAERKFFQRFPAGWRIAHLVFALVTMTLVLTGTAALFSHTSWAPVAAKALGGASGLALIHRVAAAIFVAVFAIHFVYVMQKLLRDRTFRWFGPDSLVPNWKDLADIVGMFKWFFGKGPKPRFDRWTYFEKFDYWAVFWGVTIIGGSGLMLAIPHITAQYLPGWVFNVATVVHGEEAFLAAVFLFTVHFFNNHFRPEKLPPPDIVMFTGTQSLDEFRREHPAQYQRLVDAGELDSYLVDAPSAPLTLGSKILGLVLIAFGLTLLVLVAIGFFGGG
ncbi:cytochrome b/b6 domain-containing protein [Sulfurisoma sediminicola]|uniref:Cytochrome b subunit of formate dehydrogenase n=1 Tax=Sulfurisoma sediminicola TaxID=1381557 RepID=A0A497XM96_9PROT|nr:cytochrome b/b6 domain-containing protein [Sulfurisoma sediminicola]RLJ67648.1 cytochrome b subunit of formate dehydrogenase [Sulfurisoma sediminicola]